MALEGHYCEKETGKVHVGRYIKEGSILDVHLFREASEQQCVTVTVNDLIKMSSWRGSAVDFISLFLRSFCFISHLHFKMI